MSFVSSTTRKRKTRKFSSRFYFRWRIRRVHVTTDQMRVKSAPLLSIRSKLRNTFSPACALECSSSDCLSAANLRVYSRNLINIIRIQVSGQLAIHSDVQPSSVNRRMKAWNMEQPLDWLVRKANETHAKNDCGDEKETDDRGNVLLFRFRLQAKHIS